MTEVEPLQECQSVWSEHEIRCWTQGKRGFLRTSQTMT